MGKTSRDKRDIYFRLAKEKGYRARSAYKLLQIDSHFNIFKLNDTWINRVVDLCAAPGSWSQIISEKLKDNQSDPNQDPKIIAIDLQKIAPIPNVHVIQGDITSKQTESQIINYFDGKKAQLVVCDGAPDVTGFHDLDQFVQLSLIESALSICERVLDEGGVFVAKVFRGREAYELHTKVSSHFTGLVTFFKPAASRISSLESFIVCKGFTSKKNAETPLTIPTIPIEFFRTNIDSDTYRPLKADYQSLDPVQPPIDPAYSETCRAARTKIDK